MGVQTGSERFSKSGRAISWGAAGAAILAGVVVWASRKTAPPRPLVDSQANCEVIRSQHRAALAPLQRCTRDEECAAERRNGVWSGIEGCARFRRIDAKLGELVEPLEEAWLARGCAQTFMTCTERRAQCVSGSCAELPPDPISRTWRRVTHATVFSFFIPPDLVEKPIFGDDSAGGMFEGPRYAFVYEYGDYSPTLEAREDEGESLVRREAVTISGVTANLITTRTQKGEIRSGVQIPEVPVLGGRGRSPRLSLWATCKTLEDCREITTIARSIEFH